MSQLKIACLGDFHVKLDGKALAAFQTNKVRALLAYLAVEGKVHQRSTLAQFLWPGYSEESARSSLRQALYQLRQLLREDESTASGSQPLLLQSRQTVQLNPAAQIRLDVTTFTQFLTDCADHSHSTLTACPCCQTRLQVAVDIYRGDFLADFTGDDNDPFEEWRRRKQKQLRIQMLGALSELADAAEVAGKRELALHAAQRQLTMEPWQELAHRRIMRILAQRGDRTAALAQYDHCYQILSAELGVEPDAETQALYAQIQSGVFDVGVGQKEDKTTGGQEDRRPVAPGAVESSAHRVTVTPNPPTTPVHNLPHTLPPLIGRSQALAEIAGRLQAQGTRLVTLVGPGGMGKTSLALATGRDHLSCFADGVIFVALAALNSPAALVPVIASTLGLSLQGSDPRSALLQTLRPRHLLLILDNFEHLLVEGNAAVDLVVDLLEVAPRLQIIITSRERLKLRSEQLYQVQPLTFADRATLAEAAELPSVRLFVESTQRIQPDFQLTAGNLPAVLRICRLVQGIPLGLELAAANAGVAALSTIADAIEQSAEFLSVDWRDMPERQRSMRAVFAWSWQLLSDAERHILRLCAIFRGGFTYNAAQVVVGATLPLLTRLTDKSLLQWQASADGEGRYVMHELLRQFAAEELANETAEKVQAAHRRYTQYYLHWINRRTANVSANQGSVVIVELQHELENCRQAWWLAVQQGWIDLVAVGLPGFSYLWRKTGLVVEGEKMVSDTIQSISSAASYRAINDITNQLDSVQLDSVQLDSVLSALLTDHARLLHTQRRYEAALRVAHTAVQLAEQGNDPSLLASSLLIVAKVANEIGAQRLEFVPFAQRALDIARQHGLRKAEATALLFLIDRYPQLEQQIALINDALKIAQELSDLHLERMGLELLSGAFENYGHYARALAYRQRLFDFAQMQNDAVGIAMSLSNHANTYLFLGCYATALALRQQMLVHCEHHRLEWWKSRNYGEIAYIYWAMGDPVQAYNAICTARSHETDSQTLVQLQDYYFALILVACRKLPEALQVGQRLLAQTCIQAEKHPPYLLCCLSLLAQIHNQSGALVEAMRYVEEIVQILTDYPHISMPVVHWELVAIYLTCYEVLEQANDPRANVWLQRGYEQLQSQAAHIESPDLRHSFLENIIAHRKLLTAWQSRSCLALK